MATIKRIGAVAAVMALVSIGCILLMLDFPTTRQTWCSIIGSLVCFIAAMRLARYFVTIKILPE